MQRILSLQSAALCAGLLVYCIVSVLLFDTVFLTSKVVIDEAFHIPQGLAYCNFTFDSWDPKITTLPGLYLVSALFLGPFSLCSVYWLRFVNLVAAALNFLLIYVCFSLCTRQTRWINLFSGINLSLLPPLYFFCHLYYTDVISITFVLLLVIADKTEKRILASFFGMMSVIMRQTNIIWVLMIFGQYATEEVILHSSIRPSKKQADSAISLHDMTTIINDFRSGLIFRKLPFNVWLNIAAYFTVLISFVIFVVVNGSVVVGDKTAHAASIHIPQLFYYILFCLVFGWPYFITEVVSFLQFVHKAKIMMLFIVVLFASIVYFNTLEHAYLVADNRHYTFYIWNRFYGKYFWFRYLMIPVYVFGFYGILSKMCTKYNVVSVLVYVTCTVFVLILQKMIEVRYFLIPYIFLRLQFKNIMLWQLVAEFLFYVVVNVFTFNVFFTKDIYWSDFNYVQKLIW